MGPDERPFCTQVPHLASGPAPARTQASQPPRHPLQHAMAAAAGGDWRLGGAVSASGAHSRPL